MPFSATAAILLCSLAIPLQYALGAPKEYTLIDQLPARIKASKAQFQTAWDSGVTPHMLDASLRYNESLARTILLIGKNYYDIPPSKKSVDDYLIALNVKAAFLAELDNPEGEFQGTIAPLDQQSSVSIELEKTILQMVKALSKEASGFSFDTWKPAWDKATES